MIIAQISDTHIALDAPDARRRTRDFERVVADINALDPPADVIVHTGDVVHNGRREEYAEAARILARARMPVHALVGNKDDRTGLRAALAAGGGEENGEFIQYAVDDFPVRLVVTDTRHATANKGDFCPARARQLAALIDAENTRPIAVFAHHPPFRVAVGPDPVNFETKAAMARLAGTLQHSARVVAVFCGHVHRGTAGLVGQVRASVAPATATTLRKGAYPAEMRDCPVYHVHRFDAAGGFTTESRWVTDCGLALSRLAG
ncbi:MAG: 3',5'-cyclic adenosine monophosphate phosphodiesterase CpdA [Alphaproteobacteria bacterium]|nr:MAG: 3',5'-cyclic adenosine monophosphate phosphodiesterase CpdA [Alphaproteobacteria bacterium]